MISNHTIFSALFLILTAGCIGGELQRDAIAPGELTGSVKVDGSSTVYPLTEAVGEEFQILHRAVRMTIGISGTGGGFKKFCNGEIDINDASRPITQEEIDACASNGIEFIEIPVAFDGISVMVNPENDWIGDGLTIEELREIWKPESKITKWSDIRPEWPNEEIFLVGADSDSGTFDYFTDAIIGEKGASRADYTASADDNVLVQGIAGEKYALGYFGYAYYKENQDKLKLLGIDDGNDANGKGFIKPTPDTIREGIYQPLSRPMFIYVNVNSADRPEVEKFVEYYLTEGRELVSQVGYVRLPDEAYELGLQRFWDKKTGSIFSNGSQVGVSIEDILARG